MEEIARNFGYVGVEMPLSTMLSRIGLAMILGGLIGLEREARSRPAGLRTHILISVATCVFTLIGIALFDQSMDANGIARSDMLRIIEAVVAALGFLGAGTIFVSGGSVRGLTTGAGILLAGAIGTACGFGYLLAVISSIVALIVFAALLPFERAMPRNEAPPKVED